MSGIRRLAFSLLAALGLAVPGLAVPAGAETTLRVVMHSDLKIIDPIWTTALISADHGYFVYDTLFALDEQLVVRPQMVESWTVSPDRLVWTFTLREGLAWHDGAAVTAADCVASIRRWGARDSMGQMLLGFTTELVAVDERSFRLVLKEPYGLVLAALGKTGANVPFMMPKRIADTPANTQITDATGSGPFIFKKDEWKAGEKSVYVKNPGYKPRAEPPSGLAGGKVAKLDRVEWIWIADAQTQVSALIRGEVDMIQNTPSDLLPLVEKTTNLRVQVVDKAGRQYIMRFNTLHKPFDDARIRQAVTYAVNQHEFLQANVGDPRYFKECRSFFPCGLPLESTKGWEGRLSGDLAMAKKLLAEAGYDGTPIVLLHQTDLVGHNNLATVAKPQLERAGFKVDLQAMDWQTLVTRRARKDPPTAGGWHAFFTSSGSLSIPDPVAHFMLNAACDKAQYGWPCDAEIERLRDAYARAADAASQKAIAEAVQVRAAQYPTHVPLGQFFTVTSLSDRVTGLLTAPAVVFWNVEKK